MFLWRPLVPSYLCVFYLYQSWPINLFSRSHETRAASRPPEASPPVLGAADNVEREIIMFSWCGTKYRFWCKNDKHRWGLFLQETNSSNFLYYYSWRCLIITSMIDQSRLEPHHRSIKVKKLNWTFFSTLASFLLLVFLQAHSALNLLLPFGL